MFSIFYLGLKLVINRFIFMWASEFFYHKGEISTWCINQSINLPLKYAKILEFCVNSYILQLNRISILWYNSIINHVAPNSRQRNSAFENPQHAFNIHLNRSVCLFHLILVQFCDKIFKILGSKIEWADTKDKRYGIHNITFTASIWSYYAGELIKGLYDVST